MIVLKEKEDCCGCGACAQVCPKGCITMTADNEGFALPQLDTSACIDCGLCERACPIRNAVPEDDSVKPAAFVAMSADEPTRFASSSGGIFSQLAQKVLSGGGVVYGAAFDQNFSVSHIAVTELSDLPKLRGSKYVQSDLKESYREIRALLKAGRNVLFSGTPCQTAGLRQYLGDDPENLITVSVFCHGVPSPKVWEKCLSEQEKPVQAVYFRDKTPGWRGYTFGFDYTDGTAYRIPRDEHPYFRLFLENVSLRPSCYRCRFKGLNRPADISLGDCWGIETWLPEMDDNRGTSVVLVHSEKGQAMVEALQSGARWQKVDAGKAVPKQADARHSVPKHPKREQFFSMLDSGASLEDAMVIFRPSLPQQALELAKKVRRKLLGME